MDELEDLELILMMLLLVGNTERDIHFFSDNWNVIFEQFSNLEYYPPLQRLCDVTTNSCLPISFYLRYIHDYKLQHKIVQGHKVFSPHYSYRPYEILKNKFKMYNINKFVNQTKVKTNLSRKICRNKFF